MAAAAIASAGKDKAHAEIRKLQEARAILLVSEDGMCAPYMHLHALRDFTYTYRLHT